MGPTATETATTVTTHGAGWALASLALSMLLSSLGVSIANVALPTLAQAFGASFQAVQWVVLVYLLAITVLIVGVGRLGDVVGRRRVLLGGLLVFAAASVLCGLAPTLGTLIAARALQGLGAAALMALTVASVGASVPPERTGSAMGVLGTMSAIGTALGPSLGGLLIAGPGWRAIFLAMAGLGVVTFGLAWRRLPDREQDATAGPAGFDIPGTILLGLTLAAYALAMTVGNGRFAGRQPGAAAGRRLRRRAVRRGRGAREVAADPAVGPPRCRARLRSGRQRPGLDGDDGHPGGRAVLPVARPRARRRRGRRGDVPRPVGLGVQRRPAGRIVDRFGAPAMVGGGLAAMAAGCLALALLSGPFGVAGFVAAIAVLTPGYQLFLAANNTAVMTGVGPDRKGVVSGLLSLSRNLGLITGASVMGTVFALAAATDDFATAGPDAVAAGMRVTFTVAAGLMVLALVVATAGRPRRPLTEDAG